MMVFWKARLVFLAVPKTGTQAYEAALGQQADIVMRHPTSVKHMSAQKFRRKFAPLLGPGTGKSLKTLAVIREPVDWLGSWYRYRRRPELNGHPNSTATLSFDDFVDGYLAEVQPAWANVGSQFRFVSNDRGHVITDHLFPYEDQIGLRGFLAQSLGFDVPPPPQVNRSPDRTPSRLSPELEDRLRRDHAADFDLHQAVTLGRPYSGPDT